MRAAMPSSSDFDGCILSVLPHEDADAGKQSGRLLMMTTLAAQGD